MRPPGKARFDCLCQFCFTEAAVCVTSVTLSKVSVITQSFSIVVANNLRRYSATTSFPLSPPSLVIVADVPMHMSLCLPADDP